MNPLSSPSELGADPVAKLRRLGFTDQEARVYIALVHHQHATGYELSKTLGLQRANVYSVLDSLVAKQLAKPILEKPIRYVAVKPAELLRKIREETDTLTHELEMLLQRAPTDEEMDIVWNVRGQAAIHDRIARIVSDARARILVKASFEHLQPHLQQLQKAWKRKVDIVVVLFGTGDIPFGRIYLHEGNGIPISGAADNVILVVDSSQTLIARMTEPAMGAYSNNHALIHVTEALVRHDLYMTEIMTRMGTQLEEVFGPHLVNLREHWLSPHDIEDLRKRIRAAKAEEVYPQSAAPQSGSTTT